jgi:hypothetical protein
MKVIVKKTTEPSESGQHGILVLFNTVFGKDRIIEHFHNQFFTTAWGYVIVLVSIVFTEEIQI